MERIIQSSTDAQSAVPKMFSKLDDVKVYSRRGNSITLMAKGGKGSMAIADQKLWDNFTDPNAYHLDSGAVTMYNNKLVAIKQKRGH